MKKWVISLLAVLIISSSAFCAEDEERPLANHEKDGLNARSLDQVFRLSPDEIDLGIAALIISEQWSDKVGGLKYLDDLDEIAYEIRRRCQQRRIPMNSDAIKIINDYLYEELGYGSVKEATNPEDLFLHNVMDNKKGYCLSLSMLYLAIGERLGLPLYGVVVPGHFFVRYQDMSITFNIETTSKGGTADDEHYIKEFKVPESGTLYMKSLNKLQTIGCFLNNLGTCYMEVEQHKKASETLEKSIEITPMLAESRTNLGNVYLKLGNSDKAIREYKAAIDINPNSGKAHGNLGNAFLQKNWPDDAIKEYKKALDLEPQSLESHKGLANAYIEKNMYSMAMQTIRNAIKLSPNDADLYYLLGNTYGKFKDCDNAVRHYKTALQMNPKLTNAYIGLGICYNIYNQPDEAINAFKAAVDIDSRNYAALANLGGTYFNQKKYSEAIRYYSKASKLNNGDYDVHYNLGASYFNSKNY